jgi:phage-related protein
MEFEIEFYETAEGRSPVREFLEEIKAAAPDDLAAILAGLTKLRRREYHRPPLSKPVAHGIYELRYLGRLSARVFYFFAQGRRIVLVHGIIKKGQRIPKRHIELALSRKEEWEQRHAR